ncbi:glycosyltransferase [Bordetella muralis]|jgi:hypothetical protein|uniref:glycosyltransferase n=1 Tax=Bordetella muralis TaxID=1649130 RepID=UPI0039F06551
MSQHIYVMIRYSVLSKNIGDTWVVGRTGFEEYREKLFASERLNARQDLFEKITLPSLVHQSKTPSAEWLTVFLLISEEMPVQHKDALTSLVSGYDWIKVVPLPVENTLLGRPVKAAIAEKKGELTYATVRLDDDDALAFDYFENLLRYIRPQFNGFCISFGKGVAGLMTNGKFTSFRDYYAPKAAMGMAFVNYKSKNGPVRFKSVYGIGNHLKVDQKVPTILDSKSHSFLRTIHEHADTQIERGASVYLKMKEMEASDIVDKFNIIL